MCRHEPAALLQLAVDVPGGAGARLHRNLQQRRCARRSQVRAPESAAEQPSSQDKSHHQLCQSQGEMITSSCIHSCIHQNFPPSIISINMSIKMGNANVSSFYKVLAQEITDVVASH